MRGTLLAFTIPTGKDRIRASAFAKAFYGQETSSHQGKYRYRRHGLLDDIPYCKLIRGVIIIKNENVDQVIALLKQNSALFHTRIVELTKIDCKTLGLKFE